MRGYVKTFKLKDRDKDENNELMSLSIDDEKLSEKYKTIIRIKIEDLQNIELNALSVYDDRNLTYKKIFSLKQKINPILPATTENIKFCLF